MPRVTVSMFIIVQQSGGKEETSGVDCVQGTIFGGEVCGPSHQKEDPQPTNL